MEKKEAIKINPSHPSQRYPQIGLRSGLRAGEDGIPCSKEQVGKNLFKICCPIGSDNCHIYDFSILDPSNW